MLLVLNLIGKCGVREDRASLDMDIRERGGYDRLDGVIAEVRKKMLEELGLTVYGSPREAAPSDDWTRRKRFLRESLGYLMWRIGIRV